MDAGCRLIISRGTRAEDEMTSVANEEPETGKSNSTNPDRQRGEEGVCLHPVDDVTRVWIGFRVGWQRRVALHYTS